MNEQKMREALENCIRFCNSLLDGLVGGENVPTEEDVAAARYQVWILSETVDACRMQLDRYERELNELSVAEEQMRSRIMALTAELDERKAVLAERQRKLEALETGLSRHFLPDKETPPCDSPKKNTDEEPGEDIPVLVSMLEQQNETALGLR